MSSFSTTKKHPVDGDMRQCLAIDDFFGGHEYGYWFAKKGVALIDINWDISYKKMEDVIYAEDEVKTAPVPEEYKEKKENTVKYTQSDLNNTNSWQLEDRELIELMKRLGLSSEHVEDGSLYWDDGEDMISFGLSQKILKEVKKAELRGKIIVLRSELIGFANTETGRILNDCIQRMIDRYEAQLRALEKEVKE